MVIVEGVAMSEYNRLNKTNRVQANIHVVHQAAEHLERSNKHLQHVVIAESFPELVPDPHTLHLILP